MMELIPQIKDAWMNSRDSLKADANLLTSRLQRNQVNRTSEGNISHDIMDRAYRSFQNRYDEKLGGFGRAPKFPKAHDYSFLIKYWKRTGSQKALDMAEFSLKSMRNGGMYDQVGFGFHRYSTDADFTIFRMASHRAACFTSNSHHSPENKSVGNNWNPSSRRWNEESRQGSRFDQSSTDNGISRSIRVLDSFLPSIGF